ncbi:MAG: protein kinase [Deltaproteobacteria bacterium]|nr:protein kinase [Deltaproteobacteria bacterium]
MRPGRGAPRELARRPPRRRATLAMRSCPQCNTPYPDEARVCPRDGAVLAAAPTSGTPQPADAPRHGEHRSAATQLGRKSGSVPRSPVPGERPPSGGRSAARGEPFALTVPTDEVTPPQRLVDDEGELVLGQVLGSYRLLALIGRGGMGRVYLAEHVKLGRKVALKLLKPEYAAKRDSVRRFFQEARAVNTIRHRNIVDITDFVELPDSRTFIIMELLAGSNLGELVRREGPLPLHRSLGILLQVCDALEAAHREGIVHRDLKPDNVFILNTEGERDAVKLLDFGVAKLLYSSSSDGDISLQTMEGSVVGTPAYMSPEQAGGSAVDHRSDIYSLGAIMYELFTGQRVFEARSFGEFVLKHLQAIPVPPRDLAGIPPLPGGLEAIILKCLEKKPEHRYQSVTALRTDLNRIMAGENTAALHIKPPAKRRGSRLPYLVAAAGGGVILAAAAVWLLLPDATPTGRPVIARAATGPGAATGPTAATAGAGVADQALVEFSFRSDPPGASVFAAGAPGPLGQTPFIRRRPAADRERQFVFKLDGYRDQTARPTAGATPEVFALLEPDTGARGHDGRGRPRREPERSGPDQGSPTPAPTGAGPAPSGPRPTPAPTDPLPTPAPSGKKRIDRVDTVDPFAE